MGMTNALESINRKTLYQFLLRCKNADGSFSVHEDGECDVRGAYCAMAVASMCDLVTPELCKNTADWVASCQNYEGGTFQYAIVFQKSEQKNLLARVR